MSHHEDGKWWVSPCNYDPEVTAKGADGGIIITASHNPRQWNALKLLNASGEFISSADGAQLLELAGSDDLSFAPVDGIGRVIESQSFDDEHIASILALPLVEVARVRSRRFKVVVDAVNSVGGIVVPKLLQSLGVQVIELNCEPTGEFAHNPEPLPENLTEIAARVVAEKADLGIVVDPDVDRLALICEDGSMFGEEYTLVAAADYVLSQTPGNTVSNLSSSRALSDIAQRHGGQCFSAAVGEVNVVAKMKEVGAIIGGEGNGGVIYPASHYGRDALVGIALILTHLARTGLTASQLRATYPAYVMVKEKIELDASSDIDGMLRRIATQYADEQVNTTDGVKVDFTEGWVHLRRSNTEPIVRIYAEAPTESDARALVDQIKAIL